jgi:dipeptidyl aminopeptidase/acylaminoacyl peptidase
MTSRVLPFLLALSIASAQNFTLDHYDKVFRVTDLQVAPSSASAVFVVTRPDYAGNAWESEIMSVDLASRRVRNLTHHRKTVQDPRWSPSGEQIAFLADAGGKAQIFVLDLAGGEARQITQSPTQVHSFAWKPDGAAFAYIAADEPPKRDKFDDSFTVHANDYLMRSATPPSHVWTLDPGAEAAHLRRGLRQQLRRLDQVVAFRRSHRLQRGALGRLPRLFLPPHSADRFHAARQNAVGVARDVRRSQLLP